MKQNIISLFDKVKGCICPMIVATTLVASVSACSSSDNDDPTPAVNSIKLDKSSASIKVEETVTLTATTDPAGAKVSWESSNTGIATVDNGTVTGVAEGNATITAKAGDKLTTCDITVTKKTPAPNPLDPPCLKGSNYYLIATDGTTAGKLEGRIVADFRPDDATKWLYIWVNTYSAGSCVGPNFFGEAETWVSLVVGSAGWSGAGYSIQDQALLDKLPDMNDEADKYYFHIAVKAKTASSHLIILGDGDGNEAKLAIGGTFTDNGKTYESKGDITADGEWSEIEIPMTEFFNAGLTYRKGVADTNVMSFLSGSVTGTTFEYDACFIYKKPETK